MEDLQANPERLARGTVVEAHLDKAKGPVATLLVQNGTLRPGDVIAAGPVLGKIRAMVNDRGERLMEALPSAAVEALGFSEVPTAGDAFEVFADEKAARAVVSDRVSDARTARLAQQMASRRVSLTALSDQAAEGELKELNLILKTDVQGSLEAILGSLEQLSQEEVQIRVLLSSPGEITETDIDLATASGAVVIGFNTSMASGARRAAEAASVDVRNYDVIYKLLEDIQGAMEGLLEPELVEEPLGWAEVRAVFSIGNGAVAGCYVTEGKLQRNCRLRVRRGSQVVHEGDLDSLRRIKDGVKEVNAGLRMWRGRESLHGLAGGGPAGSLLDGHGAAHLERLRWACSVSAASAPLLRRAFSALAWVRLGPGGAVLPKQVAKQHHRPHLDEHIVQVHGFLAHQPQHHDRQPQGCRGLQRNPQGPPQALPWGP